MSILNLHSYIKAIFPQLGLAGEGNFSPDFHEGSVSTAYPGQGVDLKMPNQWWIKISGNFENRRSRIPFKFR